MKKIVNLFSDLIINIINIRKKLSTDMFYMCVLQLRSYNRQIRQCMKGALPKQVSKFN